MIAQAPPITNRVCVVCRKRYTTKPSRAAHSRWCSRECMYEWRRRNVQTIKCEQCGKVVPKVRYEDGVKKATRYKFCSNECKVEASRHKYERICTQCGRGFTVDAANYKQRTCSKACRSAARHEGKARVRIPPGDSTKTSHTLDYAPVTASGVTRWLEALDHNRFDRAWVACVVEHYGEGDRARLAEILNSVRGRYRERIVEGRAKFATDEDAADEATIRNLEAWEPDDAATTA